MKNRRNHHNRAAATPVETFAEVSCEEMMEDVLGSKVLYNWLYQQEEEKYYISTKVPDFFPDYSGQEALFVEY